MGDCARSENTCANLRHCIERWGLRPPYAQCTDDGLWGHYYAERRALEFRHSHFHDAAGEERGCADAPPEDLVVAWDDMVQHDVCLRPGTPLPRMTPHCRESFAKQCHPSGTAKGQYEEIIAHIRDRVHATLASSQLQPDFAERAAAGCFILDFWIRFEEMEVGADAQSVEVCTRFYPPTGQGTSVDLSWWFHCNRWRGEKFSCLHASIRSLSDAGAAVPSQSTHEWRDGSSAPLAELDGDTHADDAHSRTIKTFCALPRLCHLSECVAGPQPPISSRKTFALLARAAGAHSHEKAGWLFRGLRKRFELHAGEESDEEEDGAENGPPTCFMDMIHDDIDDESW
jgi:hypothetical protein